MWAHLVRRETCDDSTPTLKRSDSGGQPAASIIRKTHPPGRQADGAGVGFSSIRYAMTRAVGGQQPINTISTICSAAGVDHEAQPISWLASRRSVDM
jgi:hypothetical protein